MAKDKWDKADTVGKLAGGLLVPIVLAVVGYEFNLALQERAATQKTAEMAFAILQAPKSNDLAGLREWALGVVQKTTNAAAHSLPSPAVQELRDTRLPSNSTSKRPVEYIGKGFTADAFKRYVAALKFGEWRPQFVVLHNTSSRLSEWHNVSGDQRLQNLAEYYGEMQGWSAGPHLFVADDLIWIFSPLTQPGVHSPSWNALSWGVTMVGDYDVEALDPRVRDNTVQAIAALDTAIGLDPTSLRFHREDPNTTHKDCPGKNIEKDDLIAAIQRAIANKSP